MNAVEIEQAVSELAEQPFDAAEFPYAFLMAFGNKDTTIKRLRTGASNKSDIGGVLQTNNIHLATCAPGDIAATLTALRDSPATTRAKAKFILATDGIDLEAEDITTGETIACRYADFPDHFGFFLPLAGISTVKQIRESAFDIRATSRLNRLYVELIKDNPDWGSADKRHDMNHFMARLIFCFFAEDTDIFVSDNLFTATIDQMANRDGSNTHEVIGEIFRAMNTPIPKRAEAKLPRWADTFPYVNGGLFSGSTEVPRFSKIAQRYLSHIGSLDWTQINPDIFGSMIQAVADEEERSVLGMHYTSVPNILKVLNPLFLDDLRAELEAASDNARKLANLRARMAKIRVFDPACGSGNFLVIAYKEMRALEYEINKRRGEPHRRTDIPLTNYRGIELRDFSAEIARLALIIAEYQCDVTYRGQKEALAEFLPLDAQNWITCGNALRLDWLSICPPTGTGVKFQADDLFMQPEDQAQIDFANEGGETYICGNPPYLGSQWRTTEQQEDMERVFAPITKTYRDLDYVACWFAKAVQYGKSVDCKSAFVATKSICQGIQVAMLWPFIFSSGAEIFFAHRPFTWQNLAKSNAGVTVVIVGLSFAASERKRLFDAENEMSVPNIGPYLIPMSNTIVAKSSYSLNGLPEMDYGNKPSDGGELILSREDVRALLEDFPQASVLVKKYVGAQEFTKSSHRYCLWIENDNVALAKEIPPIKQRLDAVQKIRSSSKGLQSQSNADTPHRFVYAPHRQGSALIVPSITSSNREYLPCGFIDDATVASNKCAVVYDAELWLLAIVASSLHLQWIASVCVRMRNDFSYSNTLGWNTFPVPKLTEKNRADLTAAAEGILLAREAHFPATIADLYDPEKMPANLRAAHDHNDEVLERIYIGRRFRNDTERLEKLFEMYTKMTTKVSA
ncbi:DNA methyltransferase [Phaeovulum sp. NW3]|uniref:class I SAM-dependent DNA methyltransferase n=1 Tax=Phaeovulum sp. NW3 TaxID=2934933 RepID=UPI002020AC0B|nr:DNA methyltransferase [Phaeovulum sp. NW3]MCL7465964.1 lactate dehydrogenase [Phaeovulum sp. NW3]